MAARDIYQERRETFDRVQRADQVHIASRGLAHVIAGANLWWQGRRLDQLDAQLTPEVARHLDLVGPLVVIDKVDETPPDSTTGPTDV